MARTAVMAMVGGVTSVITGGKFANGAITGAFVHLFNSEGRATYPQKGDMLKVTLSKWKDGEGGRYKSLMVNGADTGHIFVFSAYSSGPSDQWLYNLNINLDELGLGLSVLALIPGYGSIIFGSMSVTVDIYQGDMNGTALGIGSMFIKPLAPFDIWYGIEQVNK